MPGSKARAGGCGGVISRISLLAGLTPRYPEFVRTEFQGLRDITEFIPQRKFSASFLKSRALELPLSLCLPSTRCKTVPVSILNNFEISYGSLRFMGLKQFHSKFFIFGNFASINYVKHTARTKDARCELYALFCTCNR